MEMREKFIIMFHLTLFMGCACCVDVNDFSEIKKAKKSQFITLKTFEIPAGATLQLTDLLPGTVIEFDGALTFGYVEWEGPLIRIRGENITVKGKIGHIIDCRGERWWDGLGTNGGKVKPKFMELSLTSSTVTGLNVKNTPAHSFHLRDCSDVNVTDIKVDNSEGDVKGGHNTDGFDVNSQNVRISNSWVHSQDDCLAMNSGSDVVFENNVCVGGHGISIGSVGFRANNVVERVSVKHCQVINSTNGVRIKIKTYATGRVSNITYEDVVLDRITNYGIVIHSNYRNVNNMVDKPTAGVPITNIKLSNVRGTVLQGGTNVYIAVGNASNWDWENVDINGGQRMRDCQGIPEGLNVVCGK